MINLKDYYRKKEQDSKSLERINRATKYNECVDVVKRLLPVAINYIKANPPSDYNWIVIDGEECLSWMIWRDGGRDFNTTKSIHLLENGRLILIDHNGIVGYVNIEYISNLSKIAENYCPTNNKNALFDGRLDYNTMLGLQKSMSRNFDEPEKNCQW